MAIGSTAVWECRFSGAANNGGGYDSGVASAGTDYSQQDAAQLTVTDGAVTGGTAALSSVTGGFTAAMIGNAVYISSDSARRYFITAVADTNNCTLDRNVTTGGTGLTVSVGGAISDLGAIAGVAVPYAVAGNIVYVKYNASSFDFSGGTSWTFPAGGNGSNGRNLWIIGYDDVANRNKYSVPTNRPTIKNTGTVGVVSSIAHGTQFRNLIYDGNSKNVTHWGPSSGTCCFTKCSFIGITNGNLFDSGADNTTWVECSVTASGGAAMFQTGIAVRCIVTMTANNPLAYQACKAAICCIAVGAGTSNGRGFSFTSGGVYSGCIAYNCSWGFQTMNATRPAICSNSIAHTCGVGFDDGGAAGVGSAFFYGCAGYNCSTLIDASLDADMAFSGADAKAAPITLTADPFTNVATNDFSLNATAGGGAACRAVGWDVHPSGSVGYLDIGAIQHADPAGGGSGTFGHVSF